MSDKNEIEFIHATYCRNKLDNTKDMLLVKEHIHNLDGGVTPKLRIINNYQRNFYITKKGHMDHEHKKEFEFTDRLNKHSCIQAQLPFRVFKEINGYVTSTYISNRDVGESVFVYGTDVSTPVLIAKEYNDRCPNAVSPSTLAVGDYETDVLHNTGLIISGAISMKEKCHVAVTKGFLGDLADDAEKLLNEALDKYLPDIKKKRGIKEITLSIVNSPSEVTMDILKVAHGLMPDYLGFWNIGFDMAKMLQSLELANIPPKEVFSDPMVPSECKTFYYREDQLKRTKANGKTTNKGVADLWHTITSSSSFDLIDLMSTFKLLRVRETNRESYSLDNILNEELNIGKLNFSGADGLTKLEWHKKMQSEYKIEYLLYNLFDCLACEMLDDKTNDISSSLRAYLGGSELKDANRNPKRLSNSTYFSLKNKDKILASTSKGMATPLDKLTPSCGATAKHPYNWIVTLAPELTYNVGRSLLADYPLVETNITGHSYDIDVGSAYPTSQIILNISMSTRLMEVCQLEGVNEYDRRVMGLNLSGAQSNAISIAKTMFNIPRLDSLLDSFVKEIK